MNRLDRPPLHRWARWRAAVAELDLQTWQRLALAMATVWLAVSVVAGVVQMGVATLRWLLGLR